MNNDTQRLTHPEADGQNGGAAAAPPSAKPTKARKSASKQAASRRSSSRREDSPREEARPEVEEEQRKAAAAQSALEGLQQQLTALEAALAEERQKASTAGQALAELRSSEKHTEAPGQAAAQTPVGEASFGFAPLVGLHGMDLFEAGRQVFEQAIKQPPLVLKHYTNFLTGMGRVATGHSTVEPDAKDKRFTNEAWKTNPFYKALMQSYLTWQQSLKAFVDDAGLDKKDADRARFALSLYADAMAPTNTLLGNPAAMKQMYETGGASVVKGLTHMLEDLANKGGMPSQVNRKAFQVGKDLGISPGAVVFKNEVLELIQYKPTTPQVYQRPMVIVPPQVNKFYVMDLSPGKSIVEYLVNNGQQVFAISWRNPTPEQRDWGFEAYDRAMLEAIEAVRSITGSPDVNMVGSCLGGMTLATLLGHLAARGDRRVHAVTFLVTVLDTNVESTMGLFATPETIAAAREASRLRGWLRARKWRVCLPGCALTTWSGTTGSTTT